ncbi:MAG: glycosyltransferase [Nocardioides sp.]
MTIAETSSGVAEGFRAVQRTLIRPDLEIDTQVLYVASVSGAGQGGASMRQAGSEYEGPSDDSTTAAPGRLSGFGRVEEGRIAVESGRRVTFATYFNAFPASYWRRWTEFDSVRLVTTLTGTGNLIVYRSTSKGHVVRAGGLSIDADSATEYSIDLSLKPFIDGGWYWFELEAGHTELAMDSAVWGFDTERTAEGRVTIGITTFNRPDFCVAQLTNIAQDSDVLSIIDEVIVVDQGTQLVSDDPDFEAAAQALGDKLRVIRQANLGGSGGFSRAMNEALEMGASDYVLLLDDDVVCELEGIHRAVALADLAKTTCLVGGQMLSLYDRSVMHAYGEAIARYRWFWGPAPATEHGHDFAHKSLRSTSWLHRRIDVDYNGWWMCLIPTQVIREIGLSLPMFIKWDDAEFGLRAGAAGFPTVTMPGVAVWHVPWTEKDDTLDWQAYFHERNRLVSALLHSPYPRGGKLVRESLENHLKRLMSMQYSTGEIILMALQDVLDGPERMHRDITYRLAEVRAVRTQYEDGRSSADIDSFPAPAMKKPPRKGKGIGVPNSTSGKARMAASGLLRQLRPVRELAQTNPEGVVPHIDQRWYRLGHYDSAVVSSADGTTASWYRRDRSQFSDQVTRSTALHARLYREWPVLAKRYRDALPELTSPQVWKSTFEGTVEK